MQHDWAFQEDTSFFKVFQFKHTVILYDFRSPGNFIVCHCGMCIFPVLVVLLLQCAFEYLLGANSSVEANTCIRRAVSYLLFRTILSSVDGLSQAVHLFGRLIMYSDTTLRGFV